MQSLNVKGTVLLAHEGINGTVAGHDNAIQQLLDYLYAIEGFKPIECKFSHCKTPPFKRTKVKLKKEIVTLGIDGISPTVEVGKYVKPSEWNKLLSDPDVTVIDTRNNYEVEIGTFKNAVNPNTETFREFPEYIEQNMDPKKQKKVAMFCTGGIRCEKSTALMLKYGFDNVYHLKGGILKYLEEVPQEESLWEGECFVFDERVSVNQNLKKGDYDQCYACRYPITVEDKRHPDYIKGVSCPRCINKFSEERKEKFRERQRQVELARARGTTHIG